MDLSQLATPDEWITPEHPEHGDVGIKFRVRQPGTPAHSAAKTASMRELIESKSTVDLAVTECEALITGWSGVVLDGVELEFSGESAAEVLRNPGMAWMQPCFFEYLSKKKHYMKRLSEDLQRMRDAKATLQQSQTAEPDPDEK